MRPTASTIICLKTEEIIWKKLGKMREDRKGKKDHEQTVCGTGFRMEGENMHEGVWFLLYWQV